MLLAMPVLGRRLFGGSLAVWLDWPNGRRPWVVFKETGGRELGGWAAGASLFKVELDCVVGRLPKSPGFDWLTLFRS